ncbi:MAG TPA: class I SAM-dependent methyltransferase [Desulfobacterales bacterium]|nr:class I SAM-dependent methyltransferase [Desulfobacterales bacterium]
MSEYRQPISELESLRTARRALVQEGPLAILRLGVLYLTFPLWSRLRQPGQFTFAGETYRYFWSNYNVTWSNERAVEIAIARAFLLRHSAKRTVEIGNVMAHYMPVAHAVIDKFERGRHVQNGDVVDLEGEYDAILSVSTLEHVGWDEIPQEPDKHRRALDALARCVAPGGELLLTVPVGHNTSLDRALFRGETPLTEVRAMKRVARDVWLECQLAELESVAYGRPHRGANGLVIGVLRPS